MVLLWVGDAASLVAFLGYCVWHVAMGVPVQSKAAPAGLLDRRLAWITASLVGSLALDLGITLFLMEKENRDFHLARTGQATVTRVRKRAFPFGAIFALDGRFLDAQG